jgi:hypothetical protein
MKQTNDFRHRGVRMESVADGIKEESAFAFYRIPSKQKSFLLNFPSSFAWVQSLSLMLLDNPTTRVLSV